MNDILANILMALLVPVGWGLLSAWLFDRLRARRQQECRRGEAHREDSSAEAVR